MYENIETKIENVKNLYTRKIEVPKLGLILWLKDKRMRNKVIYKYYEKSIVYINMGTIQWTNS